MDAAEQFILALVSTDDLICPLNEVSSPWVGN